MHIVFRITGSKSYSYTGYCVADEKSPLDRFLVGAKRYDDERSDKRFFKYHGSNEETLKYEILASTETEWEAYLIRNEVRSSDPYSFSGPTNWPVGVHERALKENPERVGAATLKWNLRTRKTARQAYTEGLWTMVQIKDWTEKYGRQVVLRDLDNLTPTEFMQKYVASK